MTAGPQASLARAVAGLHGKGGVGKTSIMAGIAGLAAAAGQLVLLVDLDKQGDLADDLGLNSRTDEGRNLQAALLGRESLTPQPTGREGLSVIFGGVELGNLDRLVFGEIAAVDDAWQHRLAAALAPLADQYDLILIDVPPYSDAAPVLACVAARYAIIPTRADSSSIKALRHVADAFTETRPTNPDLTLLGVALFAIGSRSVRIREWARAEVAKVLGGAAPVFTTVIRHAEAPPQKGRQLGRLPHELEEDLEQQTPWWQDLRNRLGGHQDAPGDRLPPSASGLAADYAALTQELFTAIQTEEGTAEEESNR